jgi:hypothetical protein
MKSSRSTQPAVACSQTDPEASRAFTRLRLSTDIVQRDFGTRIAERDLRFSNRSGLVLTTRALVTGYLNLESHGRVDLATGNRTQSSRPTGQVV